ncbi:MAG: hypothetical protein KDB00_11490, partial [Planctomycetales bacterium]|nr:hypothetical protein [Planctomycetales bacterium]
MDRRTPVLNIKHRANIIGETKGANSALTAPAPWSLYARRLHRSQRRSEIASLQISPNLGSESEKSASHRLTCVGVETDAAEENGEHASVGPTSRRCK